MDNFGFDDDEPPGAAPKIRNPSSQLIAENAIAQWARLDFWQIWEGLALLCGYNPDWFRSNARDVLGYDAEQGNSGDTEKVLAQALYEAQEYYSPAPSDERAMLWWDIFDVLKRSDGLNAKVRPVDLLTWAKAKKFQINSGVETAVNEFYGPPQNSITKSQPKLTTEKPSETGQLASELPLDDSGTEGRLNPKTKTVLLSIILGMAIVKYKFDPDTTEKGYSKSTGSIHNDLLNQGISIDQGSIRKWLKIAAEEIKRSRP